MQHTDYDHNKLAEAVNAYRRLKEVQEEPYLLEDIQWKIDNWRQGIYKLVVVGEIKKGKSSFVNALLGNTNLAPVAARVASAVPIKISYGEKPKFRVHFLLNDPEHPEKKTKPLEIKPEDLEQYATETGTGEFVINDKSGNRNNQLGVDFISIEYPNPILKEGLVIIDLPGLGGVFKHHTRLVQQYLHPKRADHIVYVLDSTGSPLSKEEAQAIYTLKEKKMDRFLFVQTKIDAPSVEVVEKYKQENLRQISEILDKPAETIKYFTVSNTLKLDWLKTQDKDDLEESNFPILEQYLLDKLIPEKKDRLADNFFIDINTRLVEIDEALLEKIGIYQSESKEKLQALEKEAKKHQEDFTHWKNTKFTFIREQLRVALGKAQRNSFRELRTALDFDNLAEKELTELQQRQPTVSQVKEASHHIFEMIKDQTMVIAQSIMDEYEDSCREALDLAAEQLEESIPVSRLSIVSTMAAGDISLREIHVKGKISDRATKILSGVSVGGIAGGLVGGIGVKLIAVAIPVLAIPALFVSAISVIASIFTGKKANNDYEEILGEKAFHILKGNVSTGFNKLKNQILIGVEENYEHVNTEILSRFEKAVENKMKQLTSNVQACIQAAKLSRAEVNNTLRELNNRIHAVKDVDKKLEDSMAWPENESID